MAHQITGIRRVIERISLNHRLRRFSSFRKLLSSVPRPLTILDVGGEELFWRRMGFVDEPGVTVTLLNVMKIDVELPNFVSVIGDGTDMRIFRDKQFDVVFSNSVIEHVGGYTQQRMMALEIQRVGKRYFVQTPNRSFPFEPHFCMPFPQAIPLPLKIFFVQYFAFRLYGNPPNRIRAEEYLRSVRLLSEQELAELFPDARIHGERFFGLTKSFVAYGGWDSVTTRRGGALMHGSGQPNDRAPSGGLLLGVGDDGATASLNQ